MTVGLFQFSFYVKSNSQKTGKVKDLTVLYIKIAAESKQNRRL
jgi:hypothetical protein